MSDLTLTKSSPPSAPAANKVTVYVDTADKRVKSIDDAGVICTLNNNGMQNRSLVDNGSFWLTQRVNSSASALIPAMTTSTRAGQVSDRWAVTTSVAANLNWSLVDTAAAPETGLLARYYGSIISSTAGKKVMLSQWIINSCMAHVRGQKVRVSFKHNQKVGTGQTFKLGLLQLAAAGTTDTSPAFLTGAWSAVTGTDPAWGTNIAAIAPDSSPTGENGTVTGSYLEVATVVTTWTRSSAVFTVPSTAKNLIVVIFSNATGGVTDNIAISEVQLTQGTDIVDFTEPPPSETLFRCQRFFCKSFPLTVVPAASLTEATAGSGATGMIGKAAAAVLAANYSIQFPIQMWRAPTVTYFTPVAAGAQCYRYSGGAAAAQTATATRTSSLTDRGVVVTATGDALGTVGDLVGVHYTADSEFLT